MRALFKLSGCGQDLLKELEKKMIGWVRRNYAEINKKLRTGKTYNREDFSQLFPELLSDCFYEEIIKRNEKIVPCILSELLGEYGYIIAVDANVFIKNITKVRGLDEGKKYKNLVLKLSNGRVVRLKSGFIKEKEIKIGFRKYPRIYLVAKDKKGEMTSFSGETKIVKYAL